jgi:hypothetical protein
MGCGCGDDDGGTEENQRENVMPGRARRACQGIQLLPPAALIILGAAFLYAACAMCVFEFLEIFP